MARLTRRSALVLAGGSALSVHAAAPYSAAHLQSLGLNGTGVKVDLPPLADNGTSIPLQFSLQAPAGRRFTGFEIVAPENPNPVILRLRLREPVASYRFSTRIRLAMSQEVWVLAQLDDGSQIGKATHTVVTATACFDET